MQIKSHFGVLAVCISCEVILLAQIRDILNDGWRSAYHHCYAVDVVVVIRLAFLVRTQVANIFEYFLEVWSSEVKIAALYIRKYVSGCLLGFVLSVDENGGENKKNSVG